MRVSETRGLLWGDIQNSVAILADTKSDKPRGVPLTAAAQEAVRSGGGRNGPFDWATTAYIRKWWNLIRIHMNWDDKQAVPHALRHTFVSRLVQKNIPLLTIKELAGHRSIDITLRYAHLAPHNLTEAISALEPSFQHD
jgi:integrase